MYVKKRIINNIGIEVTDTFVHRDVLEKYIIFMKNKRKTSLTAEHSNEMSSK